MDNRILMVSFKNVSSVGGDGIIPLNWAESIPKYDPSSFYNWEQDNIPLWALEQRGDTLYKVMGSPGGNPDGVTFTLSSIGNYDNSKAIYDSIEDIVERIPKRLKFPVLIEICKYGNLGHLDLANITCEGEGKLEIINKAFFEDVNASAHAVADVSGSPADAALGNRSYVKTVASIIASSTMMNVSSTRLALSFADAPSWYANARLLTMQGPDTDRQANNITVYVASGDATRSWKYGATAGGFEIPHPYDWRNDYGAGASPQAAPATPATAASAWGDATPWYGSSTKDFMIEKRQEQYTTGQSTLVGYGAWFSSISLKDCQGTLILRNLLVDAGNDQNDYDGAEGQIHRGEYGIDIENTEVLLDNVTSMRNSIGGFRATNSRVKITGHCIGYRNYTKTGKQSAQRMQNGVGFFSLNSDIEWDPTAYEDSRKYINYFSKSKRGLDLRNSTLRGGISWNETTLSAIPNGGSQLLTQPRTVNGTNYISMSGTGGDTLTTTINITDCNEHGLYAEGTDIEFAGRFNSYLNVGDGMRLRRSQASLPQFTCNHNSAWGIGLEGSQLTYGTGSELFPVRADGYSQVVAGDRIIDGSIQTNNFGVTPPVLQVGRRIRNRAQFHVDSNNQNVLVNKSSSISPATINNIPLYLGQWGGSDWVNTNSVITAYSIGDTVQYLPANHFGATPYRANNQPGIVVTNNSDAELVGVNYAVNSGDTGKGKVAIASNGSNLVFRGTSSTCTTFNYYPVNNAERQFRSWISAGVVGTDNSNIELTGPTKSSRFGVPFLVENNSNLKVKPPTFVGTDNILDISGYNLLPYIVSVPQPNHTSLEVHSTRACLVANKNSHIKLFGLGGKVPFGNTGAGVNVVDSVDVLATDYADTYLGDQNQQWDRSTSSGYTKFYPNGFTSGVMDSYASRVSLVPGGANQTFNTNNPYVRTPDTNSLDEFHREGMTGGMVVRVVEDSSVDVNLVNFLFQGSPSSVSGVYYNLNGTGCEVFKDTKPTPAPNTDDTGYTYEPGTDGTYTGGSPIGGTGEPPDGGTGENGNSKFRNNLIDGTANFTTEETATSQGTIGTVAGFGTNNSLWGSLTQNDQIGSMTVIGDERCPGGGEGGSNNEDSKYRYRAYMRSAPGVSVDAPDGALSNDPNCMGSQIQIWNIADTSRIHASNILANGMDPLTWSLSAGAPGGGANMHGPMGKWRNGVSLDYYGLAGRRTTYGGCGPVFANTGAFRLIMSTRGDLKSFYDVSTLSGISSPVEGWRHTAYSGGSPVDQVNGAGYPHWTQNVRVLGAADNIRRLTGTDSDFPQGIYQLSSCLRVFGWGMPSLNPSAGVATMQPRLGGFSAFNATSGLAGQPSGAWIYTTAEPATPLPPLGMDSLGYMRNWLDESAAGMWQNAKHMAEDKVNGISIYRSHMGGQTGGEGRDHKSSNSSYGVGVRSLNIFDLERLV